MKASRLLPPFLLSVAFYGLNQEPSTLAITTNYVIQSTLDSLERGRTLFFCRKKQWYPAPSSNYYLTPLVGDF